MFEVLCLMAKITIAASGKAPEWVLLFKVGWGKLADGAEFFVDKEAYDHVLSYITNYGNEIHWDYEHASLKTKEAPAAGWIKDVVWEEGVGIKVRVEWTERAAAYIVAKEYKYFSPVFFIRKKDKRVVGLDSVALTNRPKTLNLTPILARHAAKLGQNEEVQIMNREQLIAALGLKADATDKEIQEAIAKLGIKPDASIEDILTGIAKLIPKPAEGQDPKKTKDVIPDGIVAALGLDADADTSVVVANIHALKQAADNGVSVADFNALQEKFAEREAADAVAAAMSAGKIPPSQKAWALDYYKKDQKGFDAFVAAAVQVVPVTPLPGKTEEPATGDLTDAARQVAAQMDVDEEDVKKYGMEVKHG